MKWDNRPHWKGDLINFKSSLLRHEHGGNGVGKKMSGFTKRPRQGCRAEDTAWLPQHPSEGVGVQHEDAPLQTDGWWVRGPLVSNQLHIYLPSVSVNDCFQAPCGYSDLKICISYIRWQSFCKRLPTSSPIL